MIQNWKFQRGDIFFTRFDNATGSEQSGNRPAVVLQNDVGNFYSPTLIVATLTSKAAKKNIPSRPTDASSATAARICRSSCKVYTGMTVEQEALLFAEQNGFSAPLTAGIRQAVDQIKSLALWSKLWSKPNEVSPQTKKSNDF